MTLLARAAPFAAAFTLAAASHLDAQSSTIRGTIAGGPHAGTYGGRGTVTVKQAATGRTATFRGQTKDGVKMEGIIDCRSRSS